MKFVLQATFEKFINPTRQIIKIKEIRNFTSTLNIDWIKAINDMFLNESQWTEDDEILVDDLELIRNLAKEMRYISPE
jgi:hypothetical protein